MEEIGKLLTGTIGPFLGAAGSALSWLFDQAMANPKWVAALIVGGALLWLARKVGGAVGSILTSKPALLGGVVLFVIAYIVINR